ncbi:unnamed protein product [Didymodactylos carnosus]|uniref:Protein kinase domain-containing protein n=1 Tax=Didymodactylos carnosus TaxID=1234261 RepID=A0A813TXF2_9BILA|nr:unnamed protein product [Didymodactylos carnosus]CAF0815522.1 unnamed protein product [Didymodactylos carnosus]CAF3510740.1 unnamed protein product [Didymodactylos carnosus]CAF3601578.1 unnamed protein product [Didymodactylos carnosus]
MSSNVNLIIGKTRSASTKSKQSRKKLPPRTGTKRKTPVRRPKKSTKNPAINKHRKRLSRGKRKRTRTTGKVKTSKKSKKSRPALKRKRGKSDGRSPKRGKSNGRSPKRAGVRKTRKNRRHIPKPKATANKNNLNVFDIRKPVKQVLKKRAQKQIKSTEKQHKAEEIPMIKASEVKLGKELGKGGFGKVVKGTYKGRVVAVKIPLRKEDFAEALIEFGELRNFLHRNVVEAIAYCEDPPMFIMEFMGGNTLYSWLHDSNKHTPMNWYQGVSLLLDTARGVRLLHDAGSIHGDLSTNNVLLTDDHTTAKISDFGTVQVIEKYINASLAGQVDEAVGAFRWMAPQRLRFSKPDAYSDVWSFGCIIMEFITKPRRIPFYEADTTILMSKLEQYTKGDIRDLGIPLGEFDPTAPEKLAEVMYRCLKAQRIDRLDYREIVEILQEILENIKDNGKKTTASGKGGVIDKSKWR